MKPREFNPLKLDVQAFARSGETLSGQWPLADLPRLGAGAIVLADSAPQVGWQAHGEERRVGGARQIWLHIAAQLTLGLTCQRCLAPVQQTLDLDRWLRFVDGEDQAAELDAELEDDVLALSKAFDLRWLIEDELIMVSPLVPLHTSCTPPADYVVATAEEAPGETVGTASDKPDEPRQRPFAGLGNLLKRKPGSEPSTE